MADGENALVPAPPQSARLTITYGGQQGDLPDDVMFDATDEDLRRMATEAVRGGDVPGIDAVHDVNLTDFVVDRFGAREDVPFNRISIRPKTPFGEVVLGWTDIGEDVYISLHDGNVELKRKLSVDDAQFLTQIAGRVFEREHHNKIIDGRVKMDSEVVCLPDGWEASSERA